MGLAECAPDPLGRHRQFPQVHAGGVADCRADRRTDPQNAPLAGTLGPVWPRAVLVFDQDGVQLARNVLDCRDPIIQRSEITDAPAAVEEQFLHERMPETHHRRTFILRLDLAWIQRLADIARKHETSDVHHAGLAIDLDFDGRAHELPELRTPTKRVIRAEAAATLFAYADQLTTRRPPRCV